MRKFDPETFGPLLGGTARAWRMKLDQRLKPMGLSQAKWRTLLHLSRAPEPLTQSQIAEHIGIEEPTLVSCFTVWKKKGGSCARIQHAIADAKPCICNLGLSA